MDFGGFADLLVATKDIVTEITDRFFPYGGLSKRALDVYISEIEKSDKPKEFKAWEILNAKKEFKKMKNINSILELTKEYCTDEETKKTTYSDNEEWYDSFFASACNISSEEVQSIWSLILANEIKGKVKYPLSLINVLNQLDSQTAREFKRLCENRLVFAFLKERNGTICDTFTNDIVFFDGLDENILTGIDLSMLNEFESIGLISINSNGYRKTIAEADRVLISDGDFTECIRLKNNSIDIGNVVLTRAGKYISELIEPKTAFGYHDLIKRYYTNRGYLFEKTNILIRLPTKRNCSGITFEYIKNENT